MELIEKGDKGLNGVMEVKIKLKMTISGSRVNQGLHLANHILLNLLSLLVIHQADIYSTLKRSWMTEFFSLTLPRM